MQTQNMWSKMSQSEYLLHDISVFVFECQYEQVAVTLFAGNKYFNAGNFCLNSCFLVHPR